MMRQQSPQQRAPRAPGFDDSPLGGWWDLASVSALVLFWTVGLRVITDFGVTWDENFHITYGNAILDYFESGGANDLAITYRSNFLYGGAFDLLGALVMEYGPWKAYHAWHLAVFVVAMFAYAGVWRLGRFIGGPAAGFFALCALVLHPVFVGHSFNNPKDLPFAAGYVWAVYGIIRVVSVYPRLPRRRLVWLGVLLGLAMSVRIAGLLTLGYCAVALFMTLVVRRLAAPPGRPRFAEFQRLVSQLFAITVTAWITMVSTWPWALRDPIRRPFVVLERMTYFAHHDRRMPFAGRTIRVSDDTPEYLIHYFGLKTPEFLLALCGVGAVLLVRALMQLRRVSAQRNIHTLSYLLIWASLLFPPAYAIAKGSHLYDGLRHFLFIIPMMAVIAGLTAAALLDVAASLSHTVSRRAARVVVYATFGGVGVWHTYWIARLHPHESVYFNAASGGIGAAYENYDLDYYGASYNDASKLLQRTLWQRDRSYYLNNPVLVSGCWLASAVSEYVPQNFAVTHYRRANSSKADFFLGYTRSNCHKKHKEKPIYGRVQRDGGTIALIRDLRKEQKKKRKSRKSTPSSAPDPAAREGAAEASDPMNGTPPPGDGRAATRPSGPRPLPSNANAAERTSEQARAPKP